MTQEKTSKMTVALWYVAIIMVFGFLVGTGSKLFYGTIVPQANMATELGTVLLLGFAFIAGSAAFFSPCPFAVFPAYIAYFLKTETDESYKSKLSWIHAIKIGSTVSLGIFSFYLFVGVILAIFGTALVSYVNWLKLAIIPLFFVFGIMLLMGKSISTKKLDKLTRIVAKRAKNGKHFVNMYLYGVVYGIAAAACHLPILLVLALVPILAGNFVVGFATFVAYALGASLFLLLFTVLVSVKKNFIIQNLGLYGNRVKKVLGVIFILTGVYLISFYLLTGM